MNAIERSIVRRVLQAGYEVELRRLEKALQASGSEYPLELANYQMTSRGAGSSSIQGHVLAELFAGKEPFPHWRASTDYKHVEVATFLDCRNADFLADAERELDLDKPQNGKIWVVVDPHFDDYKLRHGEPRLTEAGEIQSYTELSRAFYACHNPKANARWPDAIPFLACVVTWQGESGLWHTRPIQIDLLLPLQVSSSIEHAKLIQRAIERLNRPIQCVLVDSWYDDLKFLRWLRQRGIYAQTRMKLGPIWTRYVWLDGTRDTMQQIAQKILKDESIEARPIKRWGPDGPYTDYLVKQRIFTGVLGEEDPAKRNPEDAHPSKIQFQVVLKPGESGTFEIDWDKTSAIIWHGPNPRARIGFAYFVRWSIEGLFQIFVDSENETRPQGIARLVVDFVTLIGLVEMAATVRAELASQFPRATLGGVPMKRVAMRTLIAAALLNQYFDDAARV